MAWLNERMSSSLSTACIAALLAGTIGVGCAVPPATHKLMLAEVVPLVEVQPQPDGVMLVVGPEMEEEFGLPPGHWQSNQLRSTWRGGSWRHALRLSFKEVRDIPRGHAVASVYNAEAVPVVVVHSERRCAQSHCALQLVVEVPLSTEQMETGAQRGIGLKLLGEGEASNHFMPPSYVGGQLLAVKRLDATLASDPRAASP